MDFGSKSDIFSSMMAISMMLVAFSYPVLIYILLHKFYKRLEEESIKIRISSLYEGLNIKNRLSLFYYVIFTMRRLIYAMAAVLMTGHPLFQIMTLFMQCVLVVIYLGTV